MKRPIVLVNLQTRAVDQGQQSGRGQKRDRSTGWPPPAPRRGSCRRTDVDQRRPGKDVAGHGGETELRPRLVAAAQQDRYQQVAQRPEAENHVDHQLGADKANPAEVVEDQEDEEEDPAEYLSDALSDCPAVGVEELLDGGDVGLPPEQRRDRAHPKAAHGWQHFNIGDRIFPGTRCNTEKSFGQPASSSV